MDLVIQDFIKDFNDGASAKQLKRKYKLSNRKYNNLKKQYELKRKDWPSIPYKYATPKPCKNYSRTGGSGYTVCKWIDGKNIYFCHTDKEEKAVRIVQKLRECGWDKKEVYRILYEVEKEFENASENILQGL